METKGASVGQAGCRVRTRAANGRVSGYLGAPERMAHSPPPFPIYAQDEVQPEELRSPCALILEGGGGRQLESTHVDSSLGLGRAGRGSGRASPGPRWPPLPCAAVRMRRKICTACWEGACGAEA